MRAFSVVMAAFLILGFSARRASAQTNKWDTDYPKASLIAGNILVKGTVAAQQNWALRDNGYAQAVPKAVGGGVAIIIIIKVDPATGKWDFVNNMWAAGSIGGLQSKATYQVQAFAKQFIVVNNITTEHLLEHWSRTLLHHRSNRM